ncbi:MAG: phosphoadenylyl-sulfate reductase [Janthinobacterium lividum]
MAASVPSARVQALAEELDVRLGEIGARYSSVKLASSLAAEDMVLTHAILARVTPTAAAAGATAPSAIAAVGASAATASTGASTSATAKAAASVASQSAAQPAIGIFTLNTGRLHAETLAMLDRVQARYGYRIEAFEPDAAAVQAYVETQGLNAFYDSVDLRKQCCAIRKVEPLERALAGVQAWVTGQRREQSVTRAELHHEEHDGARGIAKFNPLADWTEAEVWAYLETFDVPVNALHARGYPSIGCEPCTRAVRADEDSRAGRWWWESRDSKECGLHTHEVQADAAQVLQSAPQTNSTSHA